MRVLALHGAGGSPADWAGVAEHLEEHELVPLALEPPWDWESVLDRIEPHAADNPPVVGMSLGGMVAALWGRRHPECPLVIDFDGHGTPTQPQRYLDPPLAEIAALREAFREYGQPELQQAIEALDCFEVFREVRCPVVLAVATEPMPGQALFQQYQRGLARDLAALPANFEVVRLPATTHAMAFDRPELVALVMREHLGRLNLAQHEPLIP